MSSDRRVAATLPINPFADEPLKILRLHTRTYPIAPVNLLNAYSITTSQSIFNILHKNQKLQFATLAGLHSPAIHCSFQRSVHLKFLATWTSAELNIERPQSHRQRYRVVNWTLKEVVDFFKNTDLYSHLL